MTPAGSRLGVTRYLNHNPVRLRGISGVPGYPGGWPTGEPHRGRGCVPAARRIWEKRAYQGMSSGMAVNRGRALCAAARLVTDENLDLYILAGAALTFTVLGFTGVSNVSVLTSAVLVLLATLALSQIRSRLACRAIATTHRADPLALLQEAIPPELDSIRFAASTYLFIGESMARLIQTGRDDIRRIMREGGHVRVLLLVPMTLGCCGRRTGPASGCSRVGSATR